MFIFIMYFKGECFIGKNEVEKWILSIGLVENKMNYFI